MEQDEMKPQLRVFHIPQVPMEAFTVPVESVEQGVHIMDVLANYDLFQLNHNIKPDYCNMNCLQILDEDGLWCDWWIELEDGNYFDDPIEYLDFLKEQHEHKVQQELEQSGSVYPKVDVSKIDELMRQTSFVTYQIEGTQTIVATGMLKIGEKMFTLTNEFTSCADPKNFNPEIGAREAIKKCSASSRDKLWELEGYHLAKLLEK
jgi:hypothetical protein